MIYPKKTFVILSFLLTISALTKAQDVQISIKDLKNTKGQVILNIYKSEASYDKEQAFKTLKFDKKNVQNGVLIIRLKLEIGEYGITMIDDENGNSELDKNFIKIPKEGFGFSDFFMEKLKKPTFQDFKKQIKEGSNNLSIRVKYL